MARAGAGSATTVGGAVYTGYGMGSSAGSAAAWSNMPLKGEIKRLERLTCGRSASKEARRSISSKMVSLREFLGNILILYCVYRLGRMNSHMIVSLFHILAVVPLFLYVGFMRDKTASHVFPLLMGLGLIVFFYHAYKVFRKMQVGSSSAWVNWIHVLFVGPLLIYIGRMGKETPRSAYELLLLGGFGAGGYHIYSFASEMNEAQ